MIPPARVGQVLLRPSTVVAAAIAGGVTLLALVDPNQPGRYPPCPILWVTGHWCPGCGGLRAIAALTEGQLGVALGLNPLVVIAIPIALALWVRQLSGRPTRRRPQGRRVPSLPSWMPWSALVVVLVFGVVRNFSFAAWLAP